MSTATGHEMDKRAAGGGFLLGEKLDVFTPEDFSDEHLQIAEMTASFAEEQIAPSTDAIEAKDFAVTRRLLREAGELGLLGADVPEEYGGYALDKVTSTLIAERLSASGSFSVTFGGQVGIGLLPLVWYGTEQQKERYLPKLVTGEWVAAYALSESSAGSDAMNIRTRATLTADGGHYVLNGEKMWITNAGFADLFTVFAKIDGDKFSAFLVERDTPGLTIGAEEHKLGLRGSSTCALNLQDCKVPASSLLGESGKGHHIAFNILNIGRYKLAATGLGAARTALRDGVRYGRDRISFGKAVTSFGLVQQMVAASTARIYALESMLYRTVGAIDAALAALDKMAPDFMQQVQKRIEEFAVECSILKIFGSETLGFVADQMLQVFGGYGYVEEYPAERSYRDARIHRIFEGTNEINRLIAVNWTLKRAREGVLPLKPAIDDAMRNAIAGSEESFTGALADEKSKLACSRTALLCCIGLAMERFGKELGEQQEVMGALADMMIQLLAMESAILRAEKFSAASLQISVTRYFTAGALQIVRSSAETVLGVALEGAPLREWTQRVRQLTSHTPVDTATLGRDISMAVVEAGQYPI